MNEADLNSVTEPHDFEHDHLVNLDTTLRCSICKELFTIPMMAPCSHSFCSMCIRESLSVKSECPVCRAPTSDGLLKRNTMLSEVIEAYKVARETILGHEKLSMRSAQIQYPGSVLGKRKRSDMSITSSGDSPGTSKMSRMDSNDSSNGIKSRRSPNDAPNTMTSPTKADSRRSMVSCPVCDEIVDAEYINLHLDQNCSLSTREIEGLVRRKQKRDGSSREGQTNGTAQAIAWAGVLGPRAVGVGKTKSKVVLNDMPLKRISKVNYDIKTTKQLKELLTDAGLSDKGDVPQLKARHERWVNLWNAEVDASKPRLRHALLKEVAEWEYALARTKNRPVPKVENPKAWLESNRGQFDRLISEVRANKKARDDTQDSAVESPSEIVDLVSSSPPAT